ncbi:MAG: ABC transporter permease [Alphaproteobacteria bacterium]
MRTLWRHYRRNVTAVIGLSILGLVVVMAISAPLVFPADPWEIVSRPFTWPFQSWAYPLGTDALGRNVAAGIFHGARVSLLIGIVATIAALFVGVIVGAFAGFYGGLIDDVLMRFTEIFQTIPSFIFIFVVVAIFAPSVEIIVLAIAIVSWPPITRLVRGEFIALRGRDFIQGCIAIGMSDMRIIFVQALPNAMAPVIVTASVMVALAILAESGLAFLGLGDPNVMSWGTMIGAGRQVLRQAWYLTAIPGIAILLTVLSLNLIGDGLNDALNPRLRGRQ